eukprot:1153074-Pelagomonas_calceolata.AAC.4
MSHAKPKQASPPAQIHFCPCSKKPSCRIGLRGPHGSGCACAQTHTLTLTNTHVPAPSIHLAALDCAALT